MSRASSSRDGSRPQHPLLADGYAERLASIKARQLVGKAGYTRSDRPDIEQELLLDLIERLPDYDSSRASRHTFIARVIDHKVASLLDYRRAAKRDPARLDCSLHTPVTGEDGEPAALSDLIEAESARSARASDLAMDFESLLAELPPTLREVCRRLPHSTVREIADELGVTRRTIHRWKKELQRRCEGIDLDDYL